MLPHLFCVGHSLPVLVKKNAAPPRCANEIFHIAKIKKSFPLSRLPFPIAKASRELNPREIKIFLVLNKLQSARASDNFADMKKREKLITVFIGDFL